MARRIHGRVAEARSQQDNEQWHLLILEELIARGGRRESRWRYYWIPQVIAFVYYQLSWLLYVLYPAWSYRLNADFEDHAEHEYMTLVAEHPEWEEEPFTSAFTADYGSFDSSGESEPATRGVVNAGAGPELARLTFLLPPCFEG